MNNLLPDKYTDIDTSLLAKTSTLIKIIVDNNEISIYNLYMEMKSKYKDVSDEDFILSLDILYLHDKIEYSSKTDMIGIKNGN